MSKALDYIHNTRNNEFDTTLILFTIFQICKSASKLRFPLTWSTLTMFDLCLYVAVHRRRIKMISIVKIAFDNSPVIYKRT